MVLQTESTATPVLAVDVSSKSSAHSDETLGSAFAYPHTFKRSHSSRRLLGQFNELAPGHEDLAPVSVAGRTMARRGHGGVMFLDLEDSAGRIQVCMRRDILHEVFVHFSGTLHIGDIVGVTGTVLRTRSGELTVLADSVMLLAPCMRSLPDKRQKVQDASISRDRRYFTLLSDGDERNRFVERSRIIQQIRRFFWTRAFVEVETAILDDVYGGAEARPFTTNCHALTRDLFMRISPELMLKRLIVGGMERVFEIGKQFRNEGLSARHHPEFTSIEVYQAYADYNDMMELTEELLRSLPTNPAQVESWLTGEPVTVNLCAPFRRLTLFEAIHAYAGTDLEGASAAEAQQLAIDVGVIVSPQATADEVAMTVFEERVEQHLIQPTFVIDYPASMCPLTKRHRRNPNVAERFELYIQGIEFANAYTELNDPSEQRRHFETQARQRLLGNELAHMPDWDFVEALEFGMPPTGGLGIGIDRLIMLLTGASNIQDVILFPLRNT